MHLEGRASQSTKRKLEKEVCKLVKIHEMIADRSKTLTQHNFTRFTADTTFHGTALYATSLNVDYNVSDAKSTVYKGFFLSAKTL